ncbi:MAG: hypothetical protein FWD13_01450 [Treponema sp.]|nr:hypothetical protein [Treponema sp.]
MAIAPIDLQTLFTQVDKVGRAQAAQKEGQALQQAIQGVQLQRKTEEQINQVNEAQNSGDGAEKVNDNSKRQNSGENKNQNKKEDKDEKKQLSVLSNPALGKKIDISL